MSFHRACCCDRATLYAAGNVATRLDIAGSSAWQFTQSGGVRATYDDPIGKIYVAVAPDGSVVIGGASSNTGPGTGGNYYMLWKLNSDLSSFAWGFAQAPSGVVLGIEIDADGDVYVAGSDWVGTGLWRLNGADGSIVWTPGNVPWTAGGAVDIDATHVYATGNNPKYAKRLKSDGSLVWSASTQQPDQAASGAIRVGPDGSVYSGEGFSVVKLDGSNGSLLDFFYAGGTILGIDVDASGNVYTCGRAWAGATDQNIYKFDADLNLLDSTSTGKVEQSIQVDDATGLIWTAGDDNPGAGITKWSSDLIQEIQFGTRENVHCVTYGYRNIPT